MLRDSLFRELSGVATPAGIAAVIAIPTATGAVPAGDCVFLDAIQDAGNVGSILRSAAAADIREVYLGVGCASAWSPRVLRAGQGAHFDLQIHERCDLAALLGAYRGMSVAAVAAAGQTLFQVELGSPVAWVFGNEGNGISGAVLAATRHRVSIPMAQGSESLNVAAAAAICLFEGVRQRLVGDGRRS
jgi:TrmH family RNA methyltransferase